MKSACTPAGEIRRKQRQRWGRTYTGVVSQVGEQEPTPNCFRLVVIPLVLMKLRSDPRIHIATVAQVDTTTSTTAAAIHQPKQTRLSILIRLKLVVEKVGTAVVQARGTKTKRQECIRHGMGA